MFAFVVLALTLTARTESGVEAERKIADPIAGTSLTAQVSSQAENILPPARPAPSNKALNLDHGQITLSWVRPEPEKILPAPPSTKAEVVLIEELQSNYPLFEKNVEKRWPLASVTKLMTAVVALEKIPKDRKIAITERAAASEGSAGNFKVGEIFEAADLVRAAIIISSNDAAMALADHYGERDFIDAMNGKAFELNLNETVFADPTGLSVLNQSSAADTKKLVRYILERHPQIFETAAKTSITIAELKSGTNRIIPSNNQFAGRPDFIGGKTGYTDDASGNLVSIFKDAGRYFLIIVFGTLERFEETDALRKWAKYNF